MTDALFTTFHVRLRISRDGRLVFACGVGRGLTAEQRRALGLAPRSARKDSAL